ncbi:MAG TPA: ABC transporter permease [Gammaproteobacteria bacterium]|nr:ABC transporter permease [Gammaproteobacteria bacterium]
MDKLRIDAAYALRALRRDLGFTIGVVLILALGIGANASFFGIVDAVLLRPLPYRDPERLVVVQEIRPPAETAQAVNPLHYVEWRECRCFEQLALSFGGYANLTGAGTEAERAMHVDVTPNLFSMLGVRAQLGRTFAASDAENERGVVLISDALWRRRFNADPTVIGKTLGLDGAEAVIIGVLPPDFRNYHSGAYGVAAGRGIDVYSPWAVKPSQWQRWDNNYSYAALARLRDGVSMQAALAELNAIQASIDERYETGSRSGTLGATLVPLQEFVTRESRAGLLLMLGAVGAAFLVACANVASLMLVRSTRRTRETGIRAALGASSLQVFRGALIESSILALAGSALGVALAAVFLRFFELVAPGRLARIHEVAFDWRVPAVGLGLGIAATVAFGLWPALRARRVDPQDALRSVGRAATDSKGRFRFRQSAVSLEVAVSASLLIVGGLLAMSFVRLNGLDRGYDGAHVLTAELGLSGPRYGYGRIETRRRFLDALVERLEAAPGVAAAGLTSTLPLRGDHFGAQAVPEGMTRQPVDWPMVQYRFVSPDFFESIGAPILEGRSLSALDEPRDVAVVSARLAKLLAPEGSAIGRRFHPGGPEHTFEVVGVVPDVHTSNLADESDPIAYVPLLWGDFSFQAPPTPAISIRTSGDPAAAVPLLRATVRSLDPDVPISNVQTMEQIDGAALAERRFQLVLVAAFGAASLLVAALGVYGALAYAVASRTRELAIRMALGAPERSVRRMVLKQGMRPVLLGLGLGVAGALVVGRFLSTLLFGVAPTDPATLMAVAAVTLVAALLAAWLPARRAARAPVLEALRYE